jgi:hypothetical protein
MAYVLLKLHRVSDRGERMVVRGVTCVALFAIIGSGCTAGGGCENTVNKIVESAEDAQFSEALKNDLRQLRDPR